MDAPRSSTQAIEAYIRAKDENRPFLAQAAFEESASLRIDGLSGGIEFPPSAQGREAIVEILVRDFARNNENVRTLCLSAPPSTDDVEFLCPWLVGMSSKDDGSVRVGCGRYLWIFDSAGPRRVNRLEIAIQVMSVVAREHLSAIMTWLYALPYPWCPPRDAALTSPELRELDPVRMWVRKLP